MLVDLGILPCLHQPQRQMFINSLLCAAGATGGGGGERQT